MAPDEQVAQLGHPGAHLMGAEHLERVGIAAQLASGILIRRGKSDVHVDTTIVVRVADGQPGAEVRPQPPTVPRSTSAATCRRPRRS